MSCVDEGVMKVIGRRNRTEGSTTPLVQLRTERAILIAEQLLVLWLENTLTEGALAAPALPDGQKMIADALNFTNDIRLRLEDVALAIPVSFVAGFPLTHETGASHGTPGKKERIIWVIKNENTLCGVIDHGRLDRQLDATAPGFFPCGRRLGGLLLNRSILLLDRSGGRLVGRWSEQESEGRRVRQLEGKKPLKILSYVLDNHGSLNQEGKI